MVAERRQLHSRCDGIIALAVEDKRLFRKFQVDGAAFTRHGALCSSENWSILYTVVCSVGVLRGVP